MHVQYWNMTRVRERERQREEEREREREREKEEEGEEERVIIMGDEIIDRASYEKCNSLFSSLSSCRCQGSQRS